jgi:hypothetical protein
MRNNLTLQINSLEALERLIGNDTQAEIEIRTSLVQKFAEKHLKPIVNSEPISKAVNDIRTEAFRILSDKCSEEIATFKSNWYATDRISDIKLKQPILDEIERMVRLKIDSVIATAVETAIAKWTATSDLEERIQKRVDYYTQEQINQLVKAKLEKIKANL